MPSNTKPRNFRHHGQWRTSADDLIHSERDALFFGGLARMVAGSQGTTQTSEHSECGTYLGDGLVISYVMAILNGRPSHFEGLLVIAKGQVVLRTMERQGSGNQGRGIATPQYFVETFQRGEWMDRIRKMYARTARAADVTILAATGESK